MNKFHHEILGRSVHVIPHELIQKYVEFHISYTDFVDLRRVPIRPMRFAEIYSMFGITTNMLCFVIYYLEQTLETKLRQELESVI
ncbi:unnamed protein product [Rhizophagus irregularis]|uniref:Uncharacterized protein n=1 Tax=Rhizophagus irregularis TaxID=588596 RepID=A0A916E2J9_9GLOM|nr:unnamed protein product [Rhizophagus irregularis]